MRRGKTVLIILLAAIALCLTGILIWGIRAGRGNFGEDLRRSFSVGQSEHTQEIDLTDIRELCLDYGSADLTFTENSRDQMILTEYFVGDPEEENYARIQRDDREGTVSVSRGKNYGGFWFFSFGSGLRRAEISIPEGYEGKLTVRTDSGNVDAEDLRIRELSISASSGDLRFETLECGTLTVNTGSGDVTASDCRGNFSLETGSGDVMIENQAGSIQTETGSGDVWISSSEGSAFGLQIETSSGDLEGTVFRALGVDENEKDYQGTYGSSPDHQIKIRTGSGDIRLD